MRFRRISGYINKDDNSAVPFVNQRLEYFHHYWNFLFQKNTGALFLYDERFESHRSLFNKLDLQLDVNASRYAKSLSLYFINHKYFNKENIILRNSRVTNLKIQNIIETFNSKFLRGDKIKNDSSICQKHHQEFYLGLKEIEKSVLRGDYSKRILNGLIKILSENKPLNEQTKSDLKFLINASIIELYYYGYSLKQIQRIPDIILFPNLKKNDFHFDKTISDFSSKSEYDDYIGKELKILTLDKQIRSLLKLITKPIKSGYYLFKINGIDLQSSNSIRIWNTTFYNPQLKLKLNYLTLRNDLKDYVKDIEMYFDDYVKEEDKLSKQSTCNAIIKTEYRPLYWGNSDKGFLKAVKEVNEALSVFKNLRYGYTGNSTTYGAISLLNYVLTDNNLCYLGAPDFQKEYNPPFKIEQEQTESFKESLESINKLDLSNSFHKSLSSIHSNLCKLRMEPYVFNFKDYWTIIYETLFPNQPYEAIDFIQKCFDFKLKSGFFIDTKIFLSSSLKFNHSFDGLTDYSLKERDLKGLDLHIPLLKKIDAKRFERKFTEIPKHVSFEFLSDIIAELSLFKNDRIKITEKLNLWIEKTINEIYSERNLETHNNISNDLSHLKLRDDFIFMSNMALQVTFRLCNKKTKSINDIIGKFG